MKLNAAIANSLWTAANLRALIRFRHALKCPAQTQRQLLRRTLTRNADSAFGRAHHFAEIKTYEDFASRVPLANYEDIEPWIERIVGGEKRVLTTEPVTRLIPTSGSTSARKLIPFTEGLQRQFNAAISPWIADLFLQIPTVMFGPAYWSITPALQSQLSEISAVPIGFDADTDYLGAKLKRLVNATMAVPSELRLLGEREVFQYFTLLCLLRQRDLRLISIWHPSFLCSLLDALPSHWENLLEDMRNGGCQYSDALPPKVCAALKLQPLPGRAKELQAADLRKPETIWPSLKTISCWGDGAAELALADLRSRFSNVFFQSKGLLATEAFVTIPFSGLKPVAVCSHFFEFIDDHGRTHLAHELSRNEAYEVVITTAGGLWRYRLRDSVQVTGFVGKTPSLRFLGRSGNVSDLFGEKLSEAFVAKVIQQTIGTLRTNPRFVLLAPEKDAAGWHYTFYIEGQPGNQCGECLDELLRANPHYAYCRDMGQLQALRVFRIKARGHETFLAHETTSGQRLGEVKPCYLSKRTDWSWRFEGEYAPSTDRQALFFTAATHC